MIQSSSTPKTHAPAASELQDVFDRHYARFIGGRKTASVKFKRPKRSPIWTIVEVETDIAKMKWSQGGTRPNYIKLQLNEKDKSGKEVLRECWTCENQLIFLGNS